ncbi:alpha-protein kinase 3 [Austrofundulus limnaeus]|uniref:non-specific serine/threonine protein kinase n=1 Tax=Austrofundulus limnaeus TaxID=52670 RepID=A0A2I4CT43_AUSLI|nr:PREDICTED: alpha-protein kinase 3-like [Austrofundulus limnaeus]
MTRLNEMGSRRTTAQFGNGRSGNGNDVGGNGRSSSCSYLSNVRPETRSTLCSVMAQLAEETQPFFEETLKSKAVSEDSTVKFTCVVTGHPTPQITWYKDDKQLDRYCGLPKYEIFRNGQSHSLHIYNCTVEDAAIYQASAINSKGIVSCSGVLEVGEMNEFKIHQRYFAKLKQKVENRCREARDKEDQEYLRTISPDRTQRKRRSTAETSLSASSLKEDEDNQEGLQAETPDAEFRLQEANAEEPGKKPAPVSDGAVCATAGGQASDDSKSRTLTSNPVQKIFTAHEPKSPFVKKKIKISNSAKVSKTDMSERTSKERMTKNDTETVHNNGISDKVMEVENNVHSPESHLDSKLVKEKHQKPATEKSALIKRFSQNETPRSQPPVFSQRLTKTASPVATSSSRAPSEKEFKNKPKRENKGDHRERLETKNQSSQSSLKAADQSVSKKGIHATERVTTIKTNGSLKTSSDKYLQHLKSAAKSSDTRTASPQRPREVAESRLSEEETSSCQKPESVSRPDEPRVVTQAHAETNRNDAPVRSEPPPDQRTISSQPPENPDDIQTSSLSRNLQAKTDKTAQDVLDKSRQSSESSVKKFPFDTRGPAENIPECNVSPATKRSQVDAAVKAVEKAETQDVEKVEGNEVEELALSGKIFEAAAPEQIKTQKTNDTGDNVATGNPANLETNEHKRASTLVEKTVSELKKLKSHVSQTAFQDQTKTSANIVSLQPIVDSTKHPKAESEVISIAELLRSQIKALESDTSPADHTNLAQGPTTTDKGVLQEAKGDDIKCNGEAIIVKHDDKAVKSTNSTPPTNLKATLMKIYQELNEEKEPAAALDVTSTKELPVCFRGPDAPATELHARRDEAVNDCSSVSDSTSKNFKDTPPSLPSKDELTEKPQPETVTQTSGSSVKETQIRTSILETNTKNMKHTKDETVQDPDIDLIQTQSPPKSPNSKVEGQLTEVSIRLSDQFKLKQSELKPKGAERKSIPAKKETDTQLVQQESSGIKECLRSDFINNLTPEASPLMRRKHCTSPVLSATPQELASGARRKLSTSSAKPEEVEETTSSTDNQTQTNGLAVKSTKISTSTGSPGPSRQSPGLQPAGEPSSATERPSLLFSRRKTMTEAPTLNQIHTEGKPAENKHNPFKAPQVIRKIRAETFSDASGHLKLWCQFFNVLNDSKIKWYKNEEEIVQVNRNAGDETPVNLTIVQASSKDSGVYRCSITNEYGTDSTDLLLSAEILAGISLREDLGVGEEIEMTPLIFSKGLADSGTWRNKFFGRVMVTQSYIGDGCSHKVWRAKVIYGLEPVFESGDTCIIKVRSPITYGGKEESCLLERNLDIMKKECKIQNLAREYCKIFSAEARVIENFGPSLEVIPVYLMYRPANTVPYATVESDLGGGYKKYSVLDHTVKTDTRTGSEAEQKCCTFQHWIFQWTNGNLLLTRLEGVDTKITNVEISVRSTGHQGLSVEGNPKVFEDFVSQHKCNYFCGLLGLKPLKVMDSLTTPAKPKGSRSPLLQRKKPTSSSSPQPGRKAPVSPRQPRKADQEGSNTHTEDKAADAPKGV